MRVKLFIMRNKSFHETLSHVYKIGETVHCVVAPIGAFRSFIESFAEFNRLNFRTQIAPSAGNVYNYIARLFPVSSHSLFDLVFIKILNMFIISPASRRARKPHTYTPTRPQAFLIHMMCCTQRKSNC